MKAIVTARRLPGSAVRVHPAGELMINYRDMSRNVMAREKALYEGHAVAAVAATSAGIAKQALKLIEVDYEVLPHVIDVGGGHAARRAAAARGHDHRAAWSPRPRQPSNVAKRVEFGPRRHRRPASPGRRDRGAHLHDRAGAPGLHRAARLRRQRVRGRPGRPVVHDPGPLHRARPLRAAARHGDVRGSASPPAEIGGGFGGKTRGLPRARRAGAVAGRRGGRSRW